MKVHLDASHRTFLVVCECGWRDLTLSRSTAWEKARRHELRAHTGDLDTHTNAQRHADATR